MTKVETISDYIIIGAGSAGCVLANRLSADPRNSVLVVEAGPDDNDWTLKMPSALTIALGRTKHNWAYQGEPEPGLNNRVLKHDRGKVLGGSSSINGMVCIRGHARDYDTWRQMGCDGWGYADVLPYFKRLESYAGGDDDYRGTDGPLKVTRSPAKNPIFQAFLDAGEQAGYPRTRDICGRVQEGFGLLDSTVHGGQRWSAVRAFLDPIRSRRNLTILTDTRTQRILFENKTAIGIEVQEKPGTLRQYRAGKEVVLSSGAVASPHLLMLSGIGPAAHLRDHGIDVVADRPGVGENLNEHPDFVMKYLCRQPISLLPHTRGLGKIKIGLQWFLSRTGVAASNQFDAVACIRSSAGVDYPDIQLTIIPIAVKEGSVDPMTVHSFQIHIGLMRAHSRGRVFLKNADPNGQAGILVNYLKDPRDRDILRKGIRLVRELIDQSAFQDLAGDEIFPGPAYVTDAELDEMLTKAVDTQWHLSGTCKMGSAQDIMAVCDSQGRVLGVENLRVVDASLMPIVVNGNTNCPTLMIAEKMSDAILGHPPLPREDREVWQNPDWETAQR
ncbi:MAG: choline dehydrogenase [Rhodospirillales bacterium]|jgi:choline dehydrogenase|uniref:choline dehydrogenase n=1 Tax=Hwanghaeella sp. 1Z406 TaxID=3402811 RepID=UPI000C936600|nr:choline dehydrogenase [Rhodospirillales bacterium]|tara:strand:- start:144 stop:1814 length:1671 start_codon:yes stop_codon:yes gene_type:complete